MMLIKCCLMSHHSYKMSIKKQTFLTYREEVDKAQDQMVWKQEIEEELDEKRDAHEEDYQQKMEEYQEKKKAVETQKKSKVSL